ncbi:serine/threonine protein kinase [Pendulispora rubella]|uniref:Serine/threonine protein kinase n=1 Tax=Pendulispora rubella TaxID=2741070 RepID=A0ABZ2L673_9BACT
MNALAAGTVVDGRFVLEGLLGEGGMGTVWSARHAIIQRPVALKFLKRKDDDCVKRFLREARIVSGLAHPNIVHIHDVMTLDDGSPIMVMDHLVGESLASRLARQRTLGVREASAIVLQVVEGVAAAHQHGVVHRDLKPENIFLVGESRSDVRVLDFGIAKLVPPEGEALLTSGLTTTGALLGTPHYMAPEQVFGEKGMDHRVDIWALGVILYECLAGRRPIDGPNLGQVLKGITMGEIEPLSRVREDVPDALAAMVHRMLSRDKDARPNSLREVASILAPFAAGEVAPRHASKAPRIIAAAAGIVALGTMFFGVRMFVSSEKTGPEPPRPSESVAPVAVVPAEVEVPDAASSAPPAVADGGVPPSPRAPSRAKRVVTEAPPPASASSHKPEPTARPPGGVFDESPYR